MKIVLIRKCKSSKSMPEDRLETLKTFQEKGLNHVKCQNLSSILLDSRNGESHDKR